MVASDLKARPKLKVAAPLLLVCRPHSGASCVTLSAFPWTVLNYLLFRLEENVLTGWVGTEADRGMRIEVVVFELRC